MSNSEDNYIGMVLEEIRDQNRAVLEAVGDMQQKVAQLPDMADNIALLKQDINVIKTAVTDTNAQQQEHDIRITRLETV